VNKLLTVVALIDPGQTRSRRVDAFELATRSGEIPVVVRAPLTFRKQASVMPYLNMKLTSYPSDVSKALLQISWGSFELSEPVEAMIN
jgi:hypothetical protein